MRFKVGDRVRTFCHSYRYSSINGLNKNGTISHLGHDWHTVSFDDGDYQAMPIVCIELETRFLNQQKIKGWLGLEPKGD